jgi:hypothetical protein
MSVPQTVRAVPFATHRSTTRSPTWSRYATTFSSQVTSSVGDGGGVAGPGVPAVAVGLETEVAVGDGEAGDADGPGVGLGVGLGSDGTLGVGAAVVAADVGVGVAAGVAVAVPGAPEQPTSRRRGSRSANVRLMRSGYGRRPRAASAECPEPVISWSVTRPLPVPAYPLSCAA